ncbi:MAG: hypothetical protein GY719_38185 [bacterium]|nr:hypothetical protein [bacterium]
MPAQVAEAPRRKDDTPRPTRKPGGSGNRIKMEEQLTRADVTRALSGDEAALSRLVDQLTPVIQGRGAGMVLGRSAAAGARLRQEVEDLVQEVFLALFSDGARVLLSWDPARGMSLKSFVRLVAERKAISILRSGRKNPRLEEPTSPEDLDDVCPRAGSERLVASRELLADLLERLEAELSPLGWRLFRWLFVEERSVAQICREADLSADAVYAWRSRLRRLAHRLRREIEPDGPWKRRLKTARMI